LSICAQDLNIYYISDFGIQEFPTVAQG